MSPNPTRMQRITLNPGRFVLRVLRGFRANQGLLLSGAVAYYTLLSIVPIFALILVLLSQVVDPQSLLETTAAYLDIMAPSQSAALTEQIAAFLEHWKVVGGVGLLILLFFSSLAFTVLENAMSVIFFHRVAVRRRHFLVSAIIPYCYILLLGLGLLLVSVITAGMQALEDRSFAVLGHVWSLAGSSPAVLHVLGVVGEILLLTSLYLVMPVGRLRLRHALVGGITAALLWELTRRVLVWYFATLSFVNVIYGSFAAAVIVLLSLEAAALILLFGAQVIAEYERCDAEVSAECGLQT